VAIGIRCPYCGAEASARQDAAPGSALPDSPPTPSDETQGASRGPRRRRWLLVTVVGAAMLLVGGAVTAVLVWRARAYPPNLVGEPAQIEYRLLDAEAQASADDLRVLAESAENVISGYAGGHLPSLTIVAAADEAAVARALSDYVEAEPEEALGALRQQGWFTWDRTIFVNLSWSFAFPGSYHAMAAQIVDAYKLSPLVTADTIGCSSRVPDREVGPAGPVWLDLGGPDYIAMRAYFDSGYWALTHESTPEAEEAQIIASGYAGTNVALEDLRGLPSWYDAPDTQALYDLSYAAMSLLVDRAGIRAPFEYWQRLAGGECWDEAFQRAFGVTIDGFYRAFEAQRPDEAAG
jgi:hypothetical protein